MPIFAYYSAHDQKHGLLSKRIGWVRKALNKWAHGNSELQKTTVQVGQDHCQQWIPAVWTFWIDGKKKDIYANSKWEHALYTTWITESCCNGKANIISREQKPDQTECMNPNWAAQY